MNHWSLHPIFDELLHIKIKWPNESDYRKQIVKSWIIAGLFSLIVIIRKSDSVEGIFGSKNNVVDWTRNALESFVHECPRYRLMPLRRKKASKGTSERCKYRKLVGCDGDFSCCCERLALFLFPSVAMRIRRNFCHFTVIDKTHYPLTGHFFFRSRLPEVA